MRCPGDVFLFYEVQHFLSQAEHIFAVHACTEHGSQKLSVAERLDAFLGELFSC